MQSLTDSILIDKLKNEENSSFQLLYKFYFPHISSYIKRNNGTIEDAEDIFQEAILVLLQKVRHPEFVLTSTLKTYLYAIAKNLWLKRLRDNKFITSNISEHNDFGTETFTIELQPEKPKEEKVISWLNKITIHCQQLLIALFFHNEPMDKLMIKMGWKNKHVAANQQYKCIQQVKKEKEKEEAL